jgi:LysR family transcriptional regulator (chromosome initiation inhibitor)
MDLAHLAALAAVVDTGTFDAAARSLHLTPSAVSQRIRTLESTVGTVLVRRSKPVTPTAAGVAYLRLARQIEALTADAALESSERPGALPVVALAINGDSLATWAMPALASLAADVVFDLYREDQDHSTALLRDGTVMAAITTDAHPVQGCTSTPLGVMHYRPVATPEFVARHFPEGPTRSSLSRAPVVVFDRKDDIQDRYLRGHGLRGSEPPRHYVPVSADFAEAVRLGFGWAMLPDQQAAHLVGAGELMCLDDDAVANIALYWQQWSLHTRALDRVAGAVRAAAASALTPMAPGPRDHPRTHS